MGPGKEGGGSQGTALTPKIRACGAALPRRCRSAPEIAIDGALHDRRGLGRLPCELRETIRVGAGAGGESELRV